MPPPPFWNHGRALLSARAVWKPQTPVWKMHVPAPQSAGTKHCFPGDGPPEHSPPPLYSHTGFGLTLPGLLKLWRTGNQPPSLLSKFQGTLSTPGVGPVEEARMPRSSRPFGMMSASLGFRTPSSFRSSPRVLLTLPEMAGGAVPITNMLENVMSSSGKNSPLNGSILSAASI